MKTSRKILIAVLLVILIAVIGVGAYWFSIPATTRNMISFMMFSSESYDNYTEFQVVDRNETSIETTGVIPVVAESNENENNVNIKTATQMLQNSDSGMLKLGSVQTVTDDEDYTGWHLVADEGASDDYPFGPSPLSYYTAGTASNLHTAILNAADVMGVDLDYVSVEVVNYFYWDDMSADDGTGHLKDTNTKIIIESDESEEVIEELKEMAINAWTVGNALSTETLVEPTLVINGDDWDNYYAYPGTATSDKSYVDDIMTSTITDEARYPEYAELVLADSDDSMSVFDLSSMTNMAFEIYAISESANNPERPQLKEVTISTPTEETWTILSDEFMSEDDTPLAPTSLEYFTAGTSLCLTSQETLVNAMLEINADDYRVEHQFFYNQSDINSADMSGSLDKVQTYVFVESDASEEDLNTFYNKALALCFAGEGLVNETEMNTELILNGNIVE